MSRKQVDSAKTRNMLHALASQSLNYVMGGEGAVAELVADVSSEIARESCSTLLGIWINHLLFTPAWTL